MSALVSLNYLMQVWYFNSHFLGVDLHLFTIWLYWSDFKLLLVPAKSVHVFWCKVDLKPPFVILSATDLLLKSPRLRRNRLVLDSQRRWKKRSNVVSVSLAWHLDISLFPKSLFGGVHVAFPGWILFNLRRTIHFNLRTLLLKLSVLVLLYLNQFFTKVLLGISQLFDWLLSISQLPINFVIKGPHLVCVMNDFL